MIKTVKFLLAAPAVATLVACGGGDSGIDGKPAFATAAKWVDASGVPIAGATVQVQLDKTYAVTSGSDGGFELKMPQDYAYPRYFAGSISKSGYLPTPIYFEFNGTSRTSSVEGKTVATRATTDADVVFSTGIGVTHLGDDSFTGSANSQLQVAATGIFWFEQFMLTAGQKVKYKTLCISIVARGIQSTTSKDYISVSQDGLPGTYVTQQMVDSPINGSYSSQEYCFDVQRFPANAKVQVQINSGNADGARGDRDDFEFTNVLGLLKP